MNIRRLFEILLHFVFPVSCPVCGKPGVKICPECKNSQYNADSSYTPENITPHVHAPDIPENITPHVHAPDIPENITPHVHAPDIPENITPHVHVSDILENITPHVHVSDIPENITPPVHSQNIPENITPPVHAQNIPENITLHVHAPNIPARILPELFTGNVITKDINGLTVYSAAKYHEDRIQQAIYSLKYKGMRELGRPLGRYMAQFFGQCKADILIPVPLHLYSTRGYNQSKELAEGMCEFWGVRILDAALWTRDVPRRASSNTRDDLTYEDFRLTRVIEGKRIALIDDVCTSGNTLSCLAETCRLEGAVVVCAYTLASA